MGQMVAALRLGRLTGGGVGSGMEAESTCWLEIEETNYSGSLNISAMLGVYH